MKFGQLKEYNMKIIFLENSYTKCEGKATSRPFHQKSKLSISLDRLSEINFLLLYVQVDV